MFVGKWRFDINHKCLFELFLVKGWRRLFTRSQVEANWFFAEPSEYIFCLKNLIGNQGHFTWTYMTVRGFVLNRLYIIPMMFSTYANYILWKKCDFSSLLLFYRRRKRENTNGSSTSCSQAVQSVTREKLNNGYDCIMLNTVTKKFENYSRDEQHYDSLGE